MEELEEQVQKLEMEYEQLFADVVFDEDPNQKLYTFRHDYTLLANDVFSWVLEKIYSNDLANPTESEGKEL